jgi:cytochrome c
MAALQHSLRGFMRPWLLSGLLALWAVAPPLGAQDLERGKEINATCAGCHGEFGQGGKKGEYPRLAHLEDQLRALRNRARVNIPMFPYTQERELADADIEKVMILPRAPGDTDRGGRIYQKECAVCHAKDGMGRGTFPRLVG